MDLTLTPELEGLVKERVASGKYQSASDVVREGLQLLKERDEEFEYHRRAIREGLDSYERGEYVEYDEDAIKDLAKDIAARGMKRLAEKQKKTGTR